MFKLLVITPSGDQEIVEVGIGGGYFDDALVLWDESIDGPLPSVTLNGMVRDGQGILVFDQEIYAHYLTRSLAPAIAGRQIDVTRIAKTRRDAIVADISPAEMASWSIKRAEALTYQASSLPADAPTLGLEATARGISLADLVTKVLAKAQALATLEAGISGHCGKLNDQLAACATLAAVAAIDINAGWPLP